MGCGRADPGLGGGAVQLGAQGCHGHAPALVVEQEVGELAGARVRERPARRAELGDAVDDVEGFLVDGDHALGVQLAQRHLQPGPGSGDLVHAVELEIE